MCICYQCDWNNSDCYKKSECRNSITEKAKEMNLNEIRDKAFACAEKHGFHEKPVNFGERLMLVVSELAEALEADRNGMWSGTNTGDFTASYYETHIRGTVEEELADAIIRIGDIAGIYNINLDGYVRAKMAYNETRPYKHGKVYG
jgi:NTP pyrophosphatase (non-canonical NTP hydrolase)